MNVTPINRYKASFRDRRSEFIGILIPAEKTELISKTLKSFRKSYPKAKHICWAYRIYSGQEIIENNSDAGEPTGTAGSQILKVLRRHMIVDAVLFVVRIFGGIKLGKKGLAQAYEKGADLAVESADLQDWSRIVIINLKGPLELYGELSQLIYRFNGRIQNDKSTATIHWEVALPFDMIDPFCDQITNTTNGQIQIITNNDKGVNTANQGGNRRVI